MKRMKLNSVLLTMALALIGSGAFGQIATPPVIDGDGSDAVWATAPIWDLLRPNLYLDEFISGPDDFSATIQVLWDANNIYVLLEEKDDTLDTQSNQAWERDHWSVYFDMNNLKINGALVTDQTTPMDSVMFMLEKIWSDTIDITKVLGVGDTLKMINGVSFVETIDSGTSYTLEMAVPFASHGVTLEAGKVIGFDSKVGDQDGAGQLDGKLALYQAADEGWHNMSYIGTAMLEADGSLSRVKVLPTIDGVKDPAWYNAKTYPLAVKNLYLDEFVDGTADFSGKVSVMHDLDNIYVLVEEKDDTLDITSNQAWERDHWSVYFDISDIKQNGALLVDQVAPRDSVQFMLEKIWSLPDDILKAIGYGDTLKMIQGTQFVEKIDTGVGYTMEMVVPFSSIGVTLAEDQVIGFDTKIGDNDGDGQLDAKLSWHQNADEGWHNAAYMGNMMLDPVFFDLGSLTDVPVEITIDGEIDGAWAQANRWKLERKNLFTEANWDGTADFDGWVSALWDADNFYVLLEVNDDTLDITSNQAWERDHWSVYFDISNIKQDGELLVDKVAPRDSVQFMLEKIWSVPDDIIKDVGYGDTLKLINGVDFVEKIDTGVGYTLEVMVPFSSIDVDLTAGKVIGWDAKIGDNDGDGQLDHKFSWNQLADEGWHNASYLGEVELMANGTIFGTPVVAPEDVTFNVDMNGMIDAGAFDPATDFVDIAGSFNNWGDPVVQAADVDADGIYTVVATDQEVDAVLEYKFRVNGMWDPISEFPGGGPNRTYTVVEGENVVNVEFNDGDTSPWVGVESNEISTLQVYPNPVTDMLHVFARSEIRSLSVTNLVGQSVMTVFVNGSTASLDMGSLDTGMYIVSVQFESGAVANKVLVKE